MPKQASSDQPPLIIYGAGGLGREIALLVMAINRRQPSWQLLGFVDDLASGEQLGLPIVGDQEWCINEAKRRHSLATVIAIGASHALQSVSLALLKSGAPFIFPNISHPDASIDWTWIDAGQGNVIGAGARVANATLGSFNIINMNTVLGHDCVLGDRCLVSPSATLNGEVELGSDVTIGAGATLLPRISIGAGATVTIGAVVGKSVDPGDVVAGNPARVVKRGNR